MVTGAAGVAAYDYVGVDHGACTDRGIFRTAGSVPVYIDDFYCDGSISSDQAASIEKN